MSESSAQRKKKTSVEELTQQYSQRQSSSSKQESKQEQAASQQFSNIESNPFFKIILNPELSPTEKKSEVAKALAFTENKAESQAALDAFNQFKAYLQFERKNMARQIIELTDTETFAELKDVYAEINDSLLAFEETMRPLTDIVDSIYNLRINDVTFDIYSEIKQDREAEEAHK